MVRRTRLRSIVLPIVLYLVLGVASGYLVWGASNGEHGLKAKEQFDAEAVELKAQLAALKDERDALGVARREPQARKRRQGPPRRGGARAARSRGQGRGGHFHRRRQKPLNTG